MLFGVFVELKPEFQQNHRAVERQLTSQPCNGCGNNSMATTKVATLVSQCLDDYFLRDLSNVSVE